MSAVALQWFRKLQIEDRSVSLVLETLARMHFAGAPLFPSQQTIANKTKLSARTVFTALRALQHFGLIHRRARFTAKEGRTSDEITLRLDRQEIHVEKADVRAFRKLTPPSQKLRGPLAKIAKDKELPTTTESCPSRGQDSGSGEPAGKGKRPSLRLVVGGGS